MCAMNETLRLPLESVWHCACFHTDCFWNGKMGPLLVHNLPHTRRGPYEPFLFDSRDTRRQWLHCAFTNTARKRLPALAGTAASLYYRMRPDAGEHVLFKEAVWLWALSQQEFLSVPQVLPTNSDHQTGQHPDPRPQSLPVWPPRVDSFWVILAVQVGRREPVLNGA